MKAIKHPYKFGNLLTPASGSTKVAKSDKAGTKYASVIMYLAPEKSSGLGNVCASASPGCVSSCLFTAGRGRFAKTIAARMERTKLWFEDRDSFKVLLIAELMRFQVQLPRGKTMAVRLNGTSDIMWEKEFPAMFEAFSSAQFYDYTKHYKRMLDFSLGKFPKNYHLTFSRSETNDKQCREIAKLGKNVACVFHKELPKTYYGRPVFDMDKTDLRFLDPAGVGGLVAKGDAKKDTTGFVIE